MCGSCLLTHGRADFAGCEEQGDANECQGRSVKCQKFGRVLHARLQMSVIAVKLTDGECVVASGEYVRRSDRFKAHIDTVRCSAGL